MTFLATVWASVFREYGEDDRLLIVRIEDLVMPNPTTTNTSQQVLKRMMEHGAGISPSAEQLQEELTETHKHVESYMGHHYNMTADARKLLEEEVASYTGAVHDMMHALGYHKDHYGLVEPTHP